MNLQQQMEEAIEANVGGVTSYEREDAGKACTQVAK